MTAAEHIYFFCLLIMKLLQFNEENYYGFVDKLVVCLTRGKQFNVFKDNNFWKYLKESVFKIRMT